MNLYQQIIDSGEKATPLPWRDFNGVLELPLDDVPAAHNTAYTVLATNYAVPMAKRLLRIAALLSDLAAEIRDAERDGKTAVWLDLDLEEAKELAELIGDANCETGG